MLTLFIALRRCRCTRRSICGHTRSWRRRPAVGWQSINVEGTAYVCSPIERCYPGFMPDTKCMVFRMHLVCILLWGSLFDTFVSHKIDRSKVKLCIFKISVQFVWIKYVRRQRFVFRLQLESCGLSVQFQMYAMRNSEQYSIIHITLHSCIHVSYAVVGTGKRVKISANMLLLALVVSIFQVPRGQNSKVRVLTCRSPK